MASKKKTNKKTSSTTKAKPSLKTVPSLRKTRTENELKDLAKKSQESDQALKENKLVKTFTEQHRIESDPVWFDEWKPKKDFEDLENRIKAIGDLDFISKEYTPGISNYNKVRRLVKDGDVDFHKKSAKTVFPLVDPPSELEKDLYTKLFPEENQAAKATDRLELLETKVADATKNYLKSQRELMVLKALLKQTYEKFHIENALNETEPLIDERKEA